MTTGKHHPVTRGDLIWLPKGSRSNLSQTKDFTTVYVEQTYRPLLPPTTQPKPPRPSLSTLLTQLTSEYTTTNPLSHAAFTTATTHLPGGNTRSVLFYHPFPLTLTSGQGCHITSLDHHTYLDLVSEFTAGFFGHSHPVIQQAALSALSKGINLGGHIEEEAQLAGHLCSRFPKSMDMIRFCNSGTEANMFAISVARNYSRKSKILVFHNAYHGGSLTFTDATTTHPMTLPYEYVWGTFNDIAATQAAIEAHGDTNLGVIIVEPMQGAGGLIVGTTPFLRYLRSTADQLGAVLIFDEVITSRLHYGGLQAHHDVYPDMTTLGKYIGGGFSVGAFGGKEEIMARLDPRLGRAEGGIPHSGTYNNNVFTMKAGLAAAGLVTEESIGRCNALGNMLRDGFRATLERCDQLKGVMKPVGFGSLVGVQIDEEGRPDAAVLRDVFFFWMLKQRIWVGKRGFMNLNLVHEERHVRQVLTAIEGFVELVAGGVL